MFRKLLILAAVAGTLAVPAGAARRAASQIVSQQLLMPGVTYQRQVQFTSRGPVVLDVVTAPKPDGSLYTLTPALAHNAVAGTERLTDVEKDASATATEVGVNGDFFAGNGPATGIVMRGGTLDEAPVSSRSSLGIAPDGTLAVARVAFDGTWRGTSQRRQLDLNDPPVSGHTTLYTSAWGPATPAENGVVEDVIASLPPTQPNRVAAGVVTEVLAQGGTPIPPGGAVLVSRGAQAPHLTAEAPAGTTVEFRLTLTPNWSGQAAAIGGGPILVANGKPVFRGDESFDDSVLNARGARSAVGQLADGRILLVTAEGGGSAYSAGMTNYELASAMARLGAVTAMGLGSGTAAGMAFDGTLLTRPVKAEPPISDALVLSYNGVYAALPSADVVSPNGDGVDDSETFSYKLVVPAQVTASLTGPGGAQITLAQDAEQPGLHTVTWNGQPSTEGQWKLNVSAADAQGRTTTAERPFLLDDTLGALQASPVNAHIDPKSHGILTATFQLVHPAKVTATIETRTGIVLATLVNAKMQPGTQKVLWDGRLWTGSLAFTGAYQVHVVAANSIGTVALIAPFVARR